LFFGELFGPKFTGIYSHVVKDFMFYLYSVLLQFGAIFFPLFFVAFFEFVCLLVYRIRFFGVVSYLKSNFQVLLSAVLYDQPEVIKYLARFRIDHVLEFVLVILEFS
jgi:hypothetical protein